MSTFESPLLTPPPKENDEAHALAEEEADNERRAVEYSDEEYDNVAQELIDAALASGNNAEQPHPLAGSTKNAEQFHQTVEEDDRRHEELMERESKKRLKRFMGSKVMRFFTERDPETGGFTYGDGALLNSLSRKKETSLDQPDDIEAEFVDEAVTEEIPVVTERESVRDRIRDRIARGKEAMKRKLSRQPEYKLQRLLDKNDKAEAKRVKMMAKADALQDMLDADEEAARQAEAARAAMIDDAHEEAIEMDSHYDHDHPMWEEAKAMMNADFEARDEAEREARIQAERDKIYDAANRKSNKKLDRAIKKSEKYQEKARKKAESISDEAAFSKIRGRTAQALRAINRQ